MNNKVCIKCLNEKEITDFYYRKDRDTYKNICKVCSKAYSKQWEIENKERKKLTNKLWAERNPEKVKAKGNRYDNSEKGKTIRRHWATENKDKVCSKSKRYRSKPETKKKINEYVKNRYNTDPIYNLKDNIRRRINEVLKKKDLTKSINTVDCLGCSWEELKIHIEKQFVDGMSWDNRSNWHLDHIKPISIANTEKEVYKLNHYTNLQPLWAEDNLKKSDNY